jgi:O-antigen/teichoic acid export membrane protein
VASFVRGLLGAKQSSLQGLDDSAQLTRVFRRGFATTFVLDLVTSAIGAVAVVVLIRGLSVSSYAYTTLFLTFAQFAGSAASGGVRTRYLREEAERVSRVGQEAPKSGFVESLGRGTLLIVALGFCAVPVAVTADLGSEFGGGATLIFSATAFAIGYAALELAVAHYQARRFFFRAGILRVLRGAVLLLASVAITLLSESVLSINIWFVASMTAVGLVAIAPIARRSLGGVTRSFRWTRFRSEELWLSSYYVFSAGFAYVDVMVASSLLSKHAVATLGASLRYLAIALAAVPALGAVLRVRTSQADLVDSLENQRSMVISWLRRATLPAALLIGIAIALAPYLIPVIDGGRYPRSIVTFQIFLITAVTAYLTAPVANILMAQRRYAALASIYSLGLLANLIGDIAVARPFGVVGIAIVSTTVYVVIDTAMVVMSLTYSPRRHATTRRR